MSTEKRHNEASDFVAKEGWCCKIKKSGRQQQQQWCSSCDYGVAEWMCPGTHVGEADRPNCSRCAVTATKILNEQYG